MTLAMIETRTALANLDAIVDTPGIDGLFLGPSDLSIALSDGKSLDPQSKDVERELDRIVAADAKGRKDRRRIIVTPPSARWRSASAACASSR